MIVAAAFCPHPPLLAPSLAQGAAAELDELRAASIDAIRDAVLPVQDAELPGRDATPLSGDASPADRGGSRPRLLVIGGGSSSMIHSPLARGTLAPYGADVEVHLGSPSCGGALELPLSLTIGAFLVSAALGPMSGAMGLSVGPDFRSSRAAADLIGLVESGDWALLVMGDGSARRAEHSPGYLDDGAAPFDDRVARALAEGDADALADLDPAVAKRVLCAGTPAWSVAGDLLGEATWDAKVTHECAPYGVAYVVASWRRAGA